MSQNSTAIDQKVNPQVLNHPVGLFVLFFTEMWERFSYYGMRGLLVLFLVSSATSENPGWEWSREDAGVLYAWYSSLVYLTPLIGGYIADKITGSRVAVVIGALLMTLGHGSMALDTEFTFYIGLTLLVLGNGMFKPNISGMVGALYNDESKKDSAFTIFYMGINAGAFLGIMLCGYIGEYIGWSYGFGLAGIFMFFGLAQFYFSKKLFGSIGQLDKSGKVEVASDASAELKAEAKAEEEAMAKGSFTKVEKDRLVVIGFFALFVIFFWWAFEQAGSSMTIFAKDYTQRVLTGGWAQTFVWVNFFLTVVPVAIVSWVLLMLVQKTFKVIPLSNIFLTISFVLIWAVVLWKVLGDFNFEQEYEVPASWFGILNSFFVISFAPVFSKIWESKYNPAGPVKFGIGLVLLGLGFGLLAFGARNIKEGMSSAEISMFFLIGAYFLHTMGELALSPVGLSYVNKLAPKRLMGFMFGMWFFASFIGNLFAGYTASYIDSLNEMMGLSGFFLLFTAIPIALGLIMFTLNGFLSKKMHGIR
ncbi:MAG: MFS transporter [Bacteroidetes bacterium]|nr:MAG: MFS transporter [Bacteroidota bacterium]